MDMKQRGMLNPYRVLDLTDEKGYLGGKLLGDLGADVIKVEKPGGDDARNIGPFYHDEEDPEKSLSWFAFNTSKRGIVLDIETVEGRDMFKNLVRSADIILESFPPGYMHQRGLGYTDLEKIHPGIIMVSISPFGQTGPYKNFKAPDIVAWAMSGFMSRFGDADRPPVQVSHFPQAYLLAAAASAVGAMMGLYHRLATGEGQYIDISIQECTAQCVEFQAILWDMMQVSQTRGQAQDSGLPLKWPCKDGYVIWLYWGGPMGTRFNRKLIDWMASEGMADEFLLNFDWDSQNFNMANLPPETLDCIISPTADFFMKHTRNELYMGATQHDVMLFPLLTVSDILENDQLIARKHWTAVDHPELGVSITYPGSFAQCSELSPQISRRAPLIGEHNLEIMKEGWNSSEVKSIHPADANTSPIRDNRTLLKQKKMLFEGLKIADFTRILAGPLVTKVFSDFGAEVVKIESSSEPELFRVSLPFKDGVPGVDRGGRLNWSGTGKRSISVNFSHPQGNELIKRIVAWADIVVENTSGGSMDRIGLGYEDLRAVNPEIIMLSTCMQGQTGPHSTHPGFGMQLTALSGFDHITGWPDREPVELGAYTDIIAPHFSILTILAALDYRNQTGKGQYLDLSQYENSIHFLAPIILEYTVNGRVAGRMGNRCPDSAPHGAYPCLGEDRWCVIAVYTDEEWDNFCRVINNPSWTGSPRFGSLKARKENEDELDQKVAEWTQRHTAETVMTLLQGVGVGAGVVRTVPEILEEDAQLKHRKFICELDHPEVGTYRAFRPHFVMSKTPSEVRRAPLLGEHNQYVFEELLGMSEDEITDLVIEGVIE